MRAFVRVCYRGANVKLGQSYTYVLQARPDPVGTWPYHDQSLSVHESSLGGMFGAMTIAATGQQQPDRDCLVLFAARQNLMAINGRRFVGDTPVFQARIGERVRFNVLTLGEEFHTFHVHGHRWQSADGQFIDTARSGQPRASPSSSPKMHRAPGSTTDTSKATCETVCRDLPRSSSGGSRPALGKLSGLALGQAGVR